MIGPPPGIAHMSFPGCSIFLTARTPYDRQILAAEAAHCARAHGRVQLLVDGQRWMIIRSPLPSAPTCSTCMDLLTLTCRAADDAGAPSCVRCVLGVRGEYDKIADVGGTTPVAMAPCCA